MLPFPIVGFYYLTCLPLGEHITVPGLMRNHLNRFLNAFPVALPTILLPIRFWVALLPLDTASTSPRNLARAYKKLRIPEMLFLTTLPTPSLRPKYSTPILIIACHHDKILSLWEVFISWICHNITNMPALEAFMATELVSCCWFGFCFGHLIIKGRTLISGPATLRCCRCSAWVWQ